MTDEVARGREALDRQDFLRREAIGARERLAVAARAALEWLQIEHEHEIRQDSVGNPIYRACSEQSCGDAPAIITALAAALSGDTGRCPTCDSPSPGLHPAVQHEGEVHVCRDPFHERVTPSNTPERIRAALSGEARGTQKDLHESHGSSQAASAPEAPPADAEIARIRRQHARGEGCWAAAHIGENGRRDVDVLLAEIATLRAVAEAAKDVTIAQRYVRTLLVEHFNDITTTPMAFRSGLAALLDQCKRLDAALGSLDRSRASGDAKNDDAGGASPGGPGSVAADGGKR